MQIKVGSAPAAWGVNFASDPRQIPWSRYLDEVSEAGYHWTELGPYGYLPTDPKTLLNELAQRDIQVIASTVMNGHLDKPADWPSVKSELMLAGKVGASLGAKHIVLIDDFY